MGRAPPHWGLEELSHTIRTILRMAPRISQYPYFPAPEYSVLIVLLLEPEVGGYRDRIYTYVYVSIRT